MFRALLMLLMLAQGVQAIEADVINTRALVGCTSPRVVGNRVLIGVDSVPVPTNAVIIRVASPSNYDDVTVSAFKSITDVSVVEKDPDNEADWLLAGDGSYRLEVRGRNKATGKGELKVITPVKIDPLVVDPPNPPPGPGPTPTPTPTPDGEAPIKADGFRVLIIYESANGVPQVAVNKTVRDYLDSHCVKGPDGKTPDYKIWDQDVQPRTPYFAEAMKRPRTQVPWILISDGKVGTEVPLPATADQTLALLKKYGGQ